MRPLKQLCIPRDIVFDPQRRDTVLDLADLLDDRIGPGPFFETNFIIEGMRTLLEQAFRRLEGKSSQGVFKLKQAMGGGKTHNLLVLGLLAKHPEFRQQIMGRFYAADPALGPVTVICFSGRESDAPLGIWGTLAEQLGAREHFRDCYSPLQAPGQKAWENLLAGRTVLIFLDELPPYLENARARAIGNSDLAQVTATRSRSPATTWCPTASSATCGATWAPPSGSISRAWRSRATASIAAGSTRISPAASARPTIPICWPAHGLMRRGSRAPRRSAGPSSPVMSSPAPSCARCSTP
jgi:hypothetical protein